ncbi:putative extracellular matrix protein FRAS1-like [Apostichopus japonicus]|uniref:Putative extracellular matrix protein FRAS1-like n=1 Tax=Stichopus japonicus TaxID=307972 RepID=A0A2G8KRZ9_STIJA|nr:putative extracellular matrix protein FRAS1-like [Apostichopus japonicus]
MSIGNLSCILSDVHRPYYASDCTSCQSSAQIVQGRPPFYGVVHGSCTTACQEGFFESTYGTCLACNPTCLTCSTFEIDGCTSCRQPLLLLNGFCVRQCGDEQYIDGGICLDCHPSCGNCRGPNENQCTSCFGTSSLVSGRCRQGCPNSKFQVLSVIAKIVALVVTPVLPFTMNTVVPVLIAREGSPWGTLVWISVAWDFTKMTLDFVEVRLYNKAKKCHYTCRSCSGGGVYECTSCSGGDVLTNFGQCSANCFGGYYNDGGICKTCNSDCLECSSPVECLVCRNPSDVLQFGECSPQCADQYFLDPLTRMCRECDWSCNACNGPLPNDCVECMDGMILRSGTCVSACGPGYHQTDGQCKECGSNCASCTSLFSCTSCQYPYFLLGEFCVSDCGPGYYSEPISRVCIRCPPNCEECHTPDSCITCTRGTYLSIDICVTNCGHSSFPNSETGLCDANIHPPTLVVNGSITTEIGGTQVLNPSFFTAYDTDTSNYDLIFIVVSPPNNGQLLKIQRGVDTILRAKDRFSYEDLLMGSVRFVHNAKKELTGFTSIKVSDRQLESHAEDVGIVIISPFPPVVTRNEPLVVEEGEIAQITPALSLQIHDEDNPLAVLVTVIEAPKHGRLLRLPERERVRAFNLDNLATGSIHYAHDGSETQFDLALLQVSDGYNVVNILFNIHILPQDNRGPILVNNIQAQVQEGDMTQITSQLLKAKDVDSDDRLLVYTLTPPANNPQRGEVLMILPIPETGLEEGWEDMGNGFMKRQMYRFRQG